MAIGDDNDFRVSVVIPAYNAGKYIARAIESVLSQRRKAYEIIVVNDGSTDNTEQAVLEYGSKVKYIKQNNAGCSAARNRGAEAATGNWIAFLDSDDEWLEGNLETQLGLLERNPELVWASGNFLKCLCSEDRRGPHIDPKTARSELGGKDYFDDFFGAFVKNCTGWTGSTIMSMGAFVEIGQFPNNPYYGEDLDVWFRLAYRWARIGFTAEPVAIYHMGIPASFSIRTKLSDFAFYFLERHLRLAADAGRAKEFSVVVRHLVKSWCRGAMFRGDAGDVKQILDRFGGYVDWRFRYGARVLMIWPGFTRWCCGWISRFVRYFKLRRDIVRRNIK